MRKKVSVTVSQSHRGERLDQFLTTELAGHIAQTISKAKVRKLIMAGAVYLNKKRVRIASKELFAGALVEVMLDTDRLFNDRASLQPPYELRAAEILFEDDFLIAVNKPAGLPTQPTLDQARDHLYAGVQRYLKKRDGPNSYVGLHHRLDFDTSGVVLFTKARQANAGVSAIFAERRAQKTYMSLAWNLSEQNLNTWTVKNHIGRAAATGKSRMRFTAVKSGGDSAETLFRVVENLGDSLLVEAHPKTGRTHQIRVHLSEMDLPILGDPTYGLREHEPMKAPRLMLHAFRLEFPHPITEKTVRVEAPIPADFRDTLEQARRARGAQS